MNAFRFRSSLSTISGSVSAVSFSSMSLYVFNRSSTVLFFSLPIGSFRLFFSCELHLVKVACVLPSSINSVGTFVVHPNCLSNCQPRLAARFSLPVSVCSDGFWLSCGAQCVFWLLVGRFGSLSGRVRFCLGSSSPYVHHVLLLLARGCCVSFALLSHVRAIGLTPMCNQSSSIRAHSKPKR
jgi:hypothetical protein